MLRQDGKSLFVLSIMCTDISSVEFFDKEENSVRLTTVLPVYYLYPFQTGSLTSKLSENPQKVNGLAGITLGAIIQSVSTVIVAFALGLAFIWKVGLIAIACTPLLISSGYIRLVRPFPSESKYRC